MNLIKKISKGKFIFIIDFLIENQLLFYFSILLGILLSCCTVFVPLFIGKYYQLLNHSNSSRGAIFDAILPGVDTLNVFLWYFFTLIIVRFFIQFTQQYFSVILNERCAQFLRNRLFDAQIHAPFHEFEKKPIGNYLMRYSGDMSAITQFVNKGILGFINDLVFVSLTYFVFIQMNVFLTQVIFLTLIVFFSVFYLLNRILKRQTKNYRDRKSSNLGFVNERLSGLFTIKALSRENVENEKFKKRSQKLYSIGLKYGRFKSLVESLLPLSTYVLLLIVLFCAFQLKKSDQHIDGSQLIILIMLIIHLTPVFKRILKVNQVWQTGLISYNRFIELSHFDVKSEANSFLVKSTKIYLTIDSLTFSKADGHHIFTDFSLGIDHPGIYLLKGESGSGKSLLMKILMGFYPIQTGEIDFAGNRFSNNSAELNKSSFAYFSNDLQFIGKSLFEMVTPSRKEEFKEIVYQAFCQFGLAHLSHQLFHRNFKMNDLSANERTLMAFVRISLSKRSLFLLDNPFLNTSEESNKYIIQYLEKLRNKKIILIIDKLAIKNIQYDKVFEI